MVHIMHEQGMLQPIQHDKVPNLKHLDRSYLKFTMDPDLHHSVPYMISNTGLGYSGDVLQAMEENEDIAYVVPEEGTSIASDDMVIPRDARNVELAHSFINFIHTPEVAAQNMEYVWYLCPNTAAYELIDEEMLEDPAMFMPDEVVAKSEVILDLGEQNALYSEAWDRVKAAK